MVDSMNETELNKKLEESKKYVGQAEFLWMHNYQNFQPDKFGLNTISNHSKIDN